MLTTPVAGAQVHQIIRREERRARLRRHLLATHALHVAAFALSLIVGAIASLYFLG